MSEENYIELTQRAHAQTFSTSIQLSSATFFFYYFATHIDEEVEYIWSRKWTLGKIMYLTTRFSCLFFLIFVLLSTNPFIWNDFPVPAPSEPRMTPKFWIACLHGWLYIGPGTVVILLAEVILQMRVYALYAKNKKLLAFLIFLMAMIVINETLLMTGTSYKLISGHKYKPFKPTGKPISSSTGIIISPICSAMSYSMAPLSWLVITIVEIILFGLVFIKTRRMRKETKLARKGNASREKSIIEIIGNDSTKYFALIFFICLIGTVLSFISQKSRSMSPSEISFILNCLNTYQTVVVVNMAIFAPKLLISIRAEYYTPMQKVEITHLWDVATRSSN